MTRQCDGDEEPYVYTHKNMMRGLLLMEQGGAVGAMPLRGVMAVLMIIDDARGI